MRSEAEEFLEGWEAAERAAGAALVVPPVQSLRLRLFQEEGSTSSETVWLWLPRKMTAQVNDEGWIEGPVTRPLRRINGRRRAALRTVFLLESAHMGSRPAARPVSQARRRMVGTLAALVSFGRATRGLEPRLSPIVRSYAAGLGLPVPELLWPSPARWLLPTDPPAIPAADAHLSEIAVLAHDWLKEVSQSVAPARVTLVPSLDRSCPSWHGVMEFARFTQACVLRDAGTGPDPLKEITDLELARLVWEMPQAAIANRLGVSCRALSREIARRGISHPPPGHWQRLALSRDGATLH